MNTTLTTAEAASLDQYEAVIEHGIRTFYEVGVALAEIRDQRLYRQRFDTFEAYCSERWNISRPRAYELMQAASIVSAIADTELPPPANEGQARALARVPEEQRTEVWRETLERTDGKPTAAAVQETYAPPPRPAALPDDDLLAGADWPAEPADLVEMAGLETVTPTVTIRSPAPEPAKPKRRPLPEAFAEAALDLAKTSERLTRLRDDDRFTRNRSQTHHQMPDLITALENATALIQAMDLGTTENEEARRWWAASLHKSSDALRDVANILQKENRNA